MTKLFSHAGVSRQSGKLKVRWANGGDSRIKMLIKDGQSDIDLIEMKHAMNKDDAVAYLLSIDFDNGNKEVRECLETEARKRKLEGWTDVVETDVSEETVTELQEIADRVIAARDANGRFLPKEEHEVDAEVAEA